MNRIIVFIALAIFIGGCETALNNSKGTVLAKVHNSYLYEEDIQGIVPNGASTRDSLILVKNFVNNWVNTELMIYQAKRNLVVQQLDLEKQLEAYRNSLIIYHYETELIRQTLDTLVSEEEIETYYYNHLNDFELKENIAKVHYVIVDSEDELLDDLDEIYNLPDTLVFDSLEAYCKDFSRAYFLDTATWVKFDDLVDIIPLETYNQELFLKGNRNIRITDDEFTYLLTFVDFRIIDDTSPLDFEMNDIRTIIINKRKVDLIRKARQDIYEKALQNAEFEIYHK